MAVRIGVPGKDVELNGPAGYGLGMWASDGSFSCDAPETEKRQKPVAIPLGHFS